MSAIFHDQFLRCFHQLVVNFRICFTFLLKYRKSKYACFYIQLGHPELGFLAPGYAISHCCSIGNNSFVLMGFPAKSFMPVARQRRLSSSVTLALKAITGSNA